MLSKRPAGLRSSSSEAPKAAAETRGAQRKAGDLRLPFGCTVPLSPADGRRSCGQQERARPTPQQDAGGPAGGAARGEAVGVIPGAP